jgi:hypothetical protein
MEKIIVSENNYPRIFRSLNENAWLPPYPGQGTNKDPIDISKSVYKLGYSVALLNKVETELESLTSEEFQIWLGWGEYSLDQSNSVVEKAPTADNFFNRYMGFE